MTFELVGMRSRFDPRGIKKALQERNADAVASAKVFADDIKSGVLNLKSEEFNQGALKFGCAQGNLGNHHLRLPDR